MSKMTESELDGAVNDVVEYVNRHGAMDPDIASQEDSVRFLGGIIEDMQLLQRTIQADIDMECTGGGD